MAPGSCTVQYKQLMTCTQSLQFCCARPKPILQKQIVVMQWWPSPPLSTLKYKYWQQTGGQSTHFCSAWPWTKQLHVFTHGHLPEPVLSIRTCYSSHESFLSKGNYQNQKYVKLGTVKPARLPSPKTWEPYFNSGGNMYSVFSFHFISCEFNSFSYSHGPSLRGT